jgi:uncharacterized protein
MISRDLAIQSADITIRGTVLLPQPTPAPGGAWPLSVLCHGIPSGVAVEGDPGYQDLARRFVEAGTAACYFNFRGTGISDGNFSLPGWAADLEAVLDEVRAGEGPFAGCDPARVALMGFSGGGAVCIVCASKRSGLRGVASLSSPADFTRLMPREGIGAFVSNARHIGIIRDPGFPPSEEEYYREMTGFTPMERVADLSPAPLLIVHGDQDDMVPVEEAHRLFDAASEPKELYVVKGGGHKLRLNPEAMDKAVGWLLEKL